MKKPRSICHPKVVKILIELFRAKARNEEKKVGRRKIFVLTAKGERIARSLYEIEKSLTTNR